MFCPICESEYQPGVTRCPDDDVDLVERLNPETSHDESEARFVPLHNLGSTVEVEMVNDIFLQNGIRSLVKSGSADAFSPVLAATAGAQILVDERDYDRALELYNAFFGGDTTPLTGTTIEEDKEFEEDEPETR
jgi:hypothetical protein